MLEAYEQAQSDPELISLRSELSLLDARVAELLRGIGVTSSARRQVRLMENWERLKQAQRQKDRRAAQAAAEEVDRLIQETADEAGDWDQILEVVNLRRKLAGEERRRVVDLRQMMTAEQVMSVGAALVEAIRQNVHDRETLVAIQQEFGRILGTGQSDRHDLQG